jgi:glucuronokinase
MITQRVGFGRIALLGNPSDGFHGKTIACAVRNFVATVEIWESPEVRVVPRPDLDATVFQSLGELRATAEVQGYYGGLRLVLATCKKFADVCAERGVMLPARRFTIRYRTSIPRQVGLGGSSAIISAAFHALMEFFEVPQSALPLPERPNAILEIETEELGIQAGLQDRVAAVYGGLVYMDFSQELMDRQGHGDYVPLDTALLPPLFVAWGDPAGESGKAHSPIRALWEKGDPAVREAMRKFARLAEEGRAALLERDVARLPHLMLANFELRRRLYGDAAIGRQTLRLIEIARRLGVPAKLPGSGGAVVGIAPEDDRDWQHLAAAYAAEGFRAERVLIGPPLAGRGLAADAQGHPWPQPVQLAEPTGWSGSARRSVGQT